MGVLASVEVVQALRRARSPGEPRGPKGGASTAAAGSLHLVVEVGGVPGKLPEVVQHLCLVLVRPAVVARGLAINVAGGLVKLVRQVGHAVHVAVVGVAVVTVRAAIAPVLGLQGGRQQEGEKCGGDQGGASHGCFSSLLTPEVKATSMPEQR